MKKFITFTMIVGALVFLLMSTLQDSHYDPVLTQSELENIKTQVNTDLFVRKEQSKLKRVQDFKRQRMPASKIKDRKKLIYKKLQAMTGDITVIKERLAPKSAKSFKLSNGLEYFELSDFFAVPKTAENQKRFPNAYEKLNFLVVQGQANTSSSFNVVENAATGEIGIFANQLKLKLKEGVSLDSVYPEARILESIPEINLYILEVTDLSEAQNVHSQLQGVEGIKRSDFEIVEVVRQPK
jgi:hypothetical protein